VRRVTAEEVDDSGVSILRVTLALSGPAQHILKVEENTVRVSLTPGSSAPDALAAADSSSATTASSGETRVVSGERPLSGPHLASNAPPTVSSLDLQSYSDSTRVVIGMNSNLSYEVRRVDPRLIVVDFPGTVLAKSLDRPLDMSEFISPVQNVRAYRSRAGTRVNINLRRSAEYEVRTTPDNLVLVDVKIPEEMQRRRAEARQGFQGAAPSTPGSTDSALRGAGREEILIGASGRTVAPQAAFGTGGGSYDPSSLMGMATGFMYDASSATSLPYSGQRINIDLVNADLHSVFRLISSVSKLNIVAGDDVSGKITVQLENVPWDQAFAAILQAKGLGSQRFGNIVRIAPIESIKSEQQSALEAKKAVDELEPLQLYVVPLNYAQASTMLDQIKGVLSPRGSAQIDSRGNQLIIRDSEKTLAQIRELVRQLDRQTGQVLIEARVVEANSSQIQSLGIQWGGGLDASANTGYATGLYFPSHVRASGGLTSTGAQNMSTWYTDQDNLLVDLGSPIGTTTALAMNFGSIPGLINLDARLSAMESEGWGKIVSSPRVTTLDNEAAHISQGTRVPFMSTSAGGTQVQFIEAALTLDVTPHVTSDGKVFLEIDIKNNRPDFSQVVQGQPAIQIKEATTKLLVANGDTTVIGGVFAVENTFAQGRVPLLSKIPLLGYLFKNSGHQTSRNELLVFITPTIVTREKATP
jgi:type IV pilus assembly protein PilQ